MANIEKFCELLRKGNPTMTFEIESDSALIRVSNGLYIAKAI